MENLGPAFGFFPQMKPRRQGLPSDSANLPIDVLRGRLAGLLGAPADIANLFRSPSPAEMFGEVNYEAPAQFPYTTEKFLKELPLAPTSRVGQAAGQAASFVPLNPMPAVRGVQKVGQVVGEELAATMMGQRPNTMMSKVVPQPLFAVAPEQGLLSVKTEPIENLLQIKPQAPVSDIGFYSATEQAALNLSRNKGTGQSFINDIMKAPDVKKEELQFTGLEDFLTNKPNVTKQEVQDFLANNRVDVQEVTLGGKEPFDANRLNQLESEYKSLKEHPIDAPTFGEEKYDELIRLMNIRDQSTTTSLYDAADQAMRSGQRAQSQGNKITAEKYFKEAELLNTRAEKLDLQGQGMASPPRYEKYQLAGGDNYREILLTLPENMSAYDKYAKSLREKYGQGGFANLPLTDIERARLDKFYAGEDVSPYKSSHFDQPNILAHMRVNDRIDADGKKMLLVEEIQSDWHQAGREKGYNDPKSQNQAQQQITALKEEHKRLGKLKEQAKTEEEKNAIAQQRFDLMNQAQELSKVGKTGVPDAPFKDTWYQLALKRLTKYAADNGYERIGLTTGKRQIERFADSLRQNVDEIAFSSGYPNKDITTIAASQNGQITFSGTVKDGKFIDGQAQGKTVEEVLGKSMAKQIAEKESGVLKGDNLTVGGEGMKKYYDEIYPKFLDKYGKKYGAKVGETSINTGKVQSKDELAAQIYGRGEIYRNLPSEQKRKIDVMFMDMARDEPIRYLDITPQMKEGTSKGQPLFAATPAIPAAGLLDEEKRKEITSLLE
jgi:hypothetical protein